MTDTVSPATQHEITPRAKSKTVIRRYRGGIEIETREYRGKMSRPQSNYIVARKVGFKRWAVYHRDVFQEKFGTGRSC